MNSYSKHVLGGGGECAEAIYVPAFSCWKLGVWGMFGGPTYKLFNFHPSLSAQFSTISTDKFQHLVEQLFLIYKFAISLFAFPSFN
jgi:hypothetical protein